MRFVNPLPGSWHNGIAGQNFVKIGYQSMILLERCPQPQLQEISTDFARRLTQFANDRAPWAEFELYEQNIAVVNSIKGWKTCT